MPTERGDRCPSPTRRAGSRRSRRAEGLAPVELDDITEVHLLPLDLLRRYVASDAAVTRNLAVARWHEIHAFVDRLPEGGQLALG